MPFYGGDIDLQNISVHELIWKTLQSDGNRIAMVDASREGRTITCKELLDKSRKCAAYLQGVGVKKGDYISILASNSLEFVCLILGIFRSGAVLAPFPLIYNEYEMIYELGIVQPRVIFVDEEELGRMKGVKEQLPLLEHIFLIGKSQEYVTVEKILEEGNPDFLRTVDIDPQNDLAVATFSSGTTGLRKCMMITHRALILTLQSRFFISGNGVFYTDRGLFHASGIQSVLSNLLIGRKIIMDSEFSLQSILENIDKYKVNVATCFPPTVIEMINSSDADKYDLSSLKTIVCAGAPVAPAAVEQMIKKYRVIFIVGYAMTEAGFISVGSITEADVLGAVGKIEPGVEVKIIDMETGDECEYGSTGEIVVRSPQTTKGYLNNQKETEALFDSDGWVMTGDIGSIDNNGNLRVTGRLKEIMKHNGISISPAELESVILQHPKVADVGVIGIPDEKCGELPKAFVVPADRTLTVQEVHDTINSSLAEIKQLKGGVELVSSIPKSATGKIQRLQLKKWLGFDKSHQHFGPVQLPRENCFKLT